MTNVNNKRSDRMPENKIAISIIRCLVAVLVVSVPLFLSGCFGMPAKHLSEINEDEVLYHTVYYYSLGSTTVFILNNGAVYTDTEIEDPMHKPDYELARTLSSEELDHITDLMSQRQSNRSDDPHEQELRNYVQQIVPESKNGDLSIDLGFSKL